MEQKSTKTSINWLACIYGDYHLNPYKIRRKQKTPKVIKSGAFFYEVMFPANPTIK